MLSVKGSWFVDYKAHGEINGFVLRGILTRSKDDRGNQKSLILVITMTLTHLFSLQITYGELVLDLYYDLAIFNLEPTRIKALQLSHLSSHDSTT